MIMDRETYFTNKDTNGCSCYLAMSDKWNLINLPSKFCVTVICFENWKKIKLGKGNLDTSSPAPSPINVQCWYEHFNFCWRYYINRRGEGYSLKGCEGAIGDCQQVWSGKLDFLFLDLFYHSSCSYHFFFGCMHCWWKKFFSRILLFFFINMAHSRRELTN